jgi:hypothetical protein
MNDKFKMLALQAQMGTADFDAGSYYVATPEMMQQFAELIVKECIDLALGSSHREDDMGAIIANKIKKHFGVEE